MNEKKPALAVISSILFLRILILCKDAAIHPQVFRYHRMLAKRFPFAVYYQVAEQVVLVYAVLDCRRSPAWTRKKLAG